MMTASLDWERVKKAAEALGVSTNTFHQWKSRGSVPHKWRLPIIRHTGGMIPAEAFDPPKRGRAA